ANNDIGGEGAVAVFGPSPAPLVIGGGLMSASCAESAKLFSATAKGLVPAGLSAAALAAFPAIRTNWRHFSKSRSAALILAASASNAWPTSEPSFPAMVPPAGPPKRVPAAVATNGSAAFATVLRTPPSWRMTLDPVALMPLHAFLKRLPRNC